MTKKAKIPAEWAALARKAAMADLLLSELQNMVDTFAPDCESDFKGFGLTHFKTARAAIRKAKKGGV